AGHQSPARRAGPRLPGDPRERHPRPGLRRRAHRPGRHPAVRSNAGGIAATAIALFLGILVVTQFRSQDVYSRSLQLETPSSLTTLIANLSDRNNSLRDEIFDLRLRVAAARDSVANGQGSLIESQREIDQLKVFAAVSPARGQGITVKIDGSFDDRAMSDLVNELR